MFQQFLAFDMNDLVSSSDESEQSCSTNGIGSLPDNLSSIAKGVLPRDCCLQVEEVLDTGNSTLSQLEFITGKDKSLSSLHMDGSNRGDLNQVGKKGGKVEKKGNVIDSAADSYQALMSKYSPGNRLLKVLLSDGVQHVYGFERVSSSGSGSSKKCDGSSGGGGVEIGNVFQEHLKMNEEYFTFKSMFCASAERQREALDKWKRRLGEEVGDDDYGMEWGVSRLVAEEFRELKGKEGALPPVIVGSKMLVRSGTEVLNGMLLLDSVKVEHGPRQCLQNCVFLGGEVEGLVENHFEHYVKLLRYSLR